MASTIDDSAKSDRKVIFLVFLDNQSNSVIINHLILLFKKFLFESRENKFKVNVTSFQFYVSYIYEIENKIAKNVENLKLIYVSGRRLQICYHVDETHDLFKLFVWKSVTASE